MNQFNIPFEIPLEQLEQLERKYGIELHVDQYEDVDTPDAYFIKASNSYIYIGHTLDSAIQYLVDTYGY